MKRIVLDTNVLLISLPHISPYRPIFDNLLSGKFTLLITEDIFQEYLEIIAQKTTPAIADNIGRTLNQLINVAKVTTFYKWNLLTEDPDDNKFIDCAISGNAHYIVTNDKHFNILEQIKFPSINVLKADIFLKELNEQSQ
ncbi:putative toxin-antitoxin system toxin component, PIN family [Petrimonas sp.]|uniref:putative toxin-antitoxin system toxin component, PIN family n=1 Tax=Petrimonas sp. TaxID=2023866 RepID=UPI003F51A5BC